METVLNFKEWRKPQNHMKIVKIDEMKQHVGTTDTFMHENFTITILVEIDDIDEPDNIKKMEEVREVLKPYLKDSFNVFKIKKIE